MMADWHNASFTNIQPMYYNGMPLQYGMGPYGQPCSNATYYSGAQQRYYSTQPVSNLYQKYSSALTLSSFSATALSKLPFINEFNAAHFLCRNPSISYGYI